MRRRGLAPRLAARAGALLVAAIVAAVVDGTTMAQASAAVRGHGASRDRLPGIPGRQRVEHADHRPAGRRDSATWLASMDASTTFLHPDYGPSGNARSPTASRGRSSLRHSPLVHVTFNYAVAERPGPVSAVGVDADRRGVRSPRHHGEPVHVHALRALGHALPRRKESTAGSGAIWNLRSDALRPAGWTSADAAGLPILPGLVNYDEVASGSMDHAIRFTAACTQQAYLWPARHEAGQDDSGVPADGSALQAVGRLHPSRVANAPPCARPSSRP